MKKVLFFLFMAATTAFMACKGEQGEPGPAGVDGNADVRSYVTSISSAQWMFVNSDEYNLTLNVPIITEGIAELGLVMVYFKTDAYGFIPDSWTALPFTISRNSYTESFSFTVEPGAILLRNISNDNIPITPDAEVRIVAATADGRQAPVNWNDYADVQEYFQLGE